MTQTNSIISISKNGTDNLMATVSISILTPSFNRGELLIRLYQSIIKQTFRDFEWLIIDDGSTDNTRKIAEECIL